MPTKTNEKKKSVLRQVLVAIVALFLLYVGIAAIYRNFHRESSPNGGAQLQEAWCQDWLGVLQGVTALLETVKDEASAKNVAPKLVDYSREIEKLAVRKKSLPKVSSPDSDRIMARFMPEFNKLQSKMLEVAKTLKKVNDEPTFTEAWNKVLEAASQLQTE